jgi:hypothetical protein
MINSMLQLGGRGCRVELIRLALALGVSPAKLASATYQDNSSEDSLEI